MDSGRGPPKRIRGNHQSPSTLASSFNGIAMRDNATLLSQIHLLDQVGQLGNSWRRPGQSIMVNNGNSHLVPENNLVQHFWPTPHIQGKILFSYFDVLLFDISSHLFDKYTYL
ncbi:hypothetical protein MtrunA17_Chr2g0315691 [Medicago truncatula]|uniref:Uncharacterized protein n=1 Tax=Medicago truncatula TaxID=3880 RepID=A0A396JES7_MEDTR|nr:hypothetical protein MtrunA17_Chr2g0315691 [Medicago truncatula]